MRIVIRILVGLLLTAGLAACGGSQPSANQASQPNQPNQIVPAEPAADQAGYVAPPELTGAVRGADGGVTLSGHAAPGARVRLASPEGQSIGVTAGPDGTWTTAMAPSATPRMFSLDVVVGGDDPARQRVIKAEGPVMVLPAPGPPAVTPRAGFGALPVGKPGALVIVAVDYDAGGGAAVAGLSPPRALVKLFIDGAQAGSDESDDRGRFAILAAARPVAPGMRTLQVSAGSATDQVQAAVAPPAPLVGQFYRAQREEGRWRIDWALTGGGVQTTLVFDERARP